MKKEPKIMQRFLTPRLLMQAKNIPEGVYVVAAGEPQEFTSRSDRKMWRQDCALIDLDNPNGSMTFTHLAMDASDCVGPREVMIFDTTFLEARAISQGEGRASIVLQLSIPSSANRHTVNLGEKVA